MCSTCIVNRQSQHRLRLKQVTWHATDLHFALHPLSQSKSLPQLINYFMYMPAAKCTSHQQHQGEFQRDAPYLCVLPLVPAQQVGRHTDTTCADLCSNAGESEVLTKGIQDIRKAVAVAVNRIRQCVTQLSLCCWWRESVSL